MTIPMGRVMADSRKDPTVKARFNISSWSLQMVQPFISRYSSESSESGMDVFEKLRLELFSGGRETRETSDFFLHWICFCFNAAALLAAPHDNKTVTPETTLKNVKSVMLYR